MQSKNRTKTRRRGKGAKPPRQITELHTSKTERTGAEEEVQGSEYWKKAIIDSIPDIAWLKDGQFRFVAVNDRLCEAFGMKATDLIGKTDFEVSPNELAEKYSADDEEVMSTGKHKRIEEQWELPNGERIWIETVKTPIFDETGRIIAIRGVAHNITQRKRAEAERRKLMEVLIEKNRELEEIIRVATHDLRTPMVNIEGFGRILNQSCEQIRTLIGQQKNTGKLKKQLDEVIAVDIPEALGIINSGMSKMKSLLDGLLHLAKLGYSATEIVQLDMNTEIGNILDTMKFQVEQSGAEIKVGPLPSCLGDKSQINQVFSNLLANALNFLDSSRPGLVRITGQTEENYSVYCVQDNGVGIAADNIDNIFRMFYRVRSADDDSEGLGLAIVRRIVNRHNGEVWVESHYGKGSKFFVKLPRQ